ASIAADPGGSTLQPANPVRSLTVPSADCRRSSSCTPGSSAVIVAASGPIVSTGARKGALGASAGMGLGLATPAIAGPARAGLAGLESPAAGLAAGLEPEPHPAATSHASK